MTKITPGMRPVGQGIDVLQLTKELGCWRPARDVLTLVFFQSVDGRDAAVGAVWNIFESQALIAGSRHGDAAIPPDSRREERERVAISTAIRTNRHEARLRDR